MGFNHGFERKMFNREQRHFMEKCLKAGMSEADIHAMCEYDLGVFRQYRRDMEHAVDLSEMMTTDECTGDTRYMDMDELPADAPLVKYVDRYSWIDEIDDSELYKAIIAMKPSYIEIITLMMEGYQQNDIAAILHSSFQAVQNKIARIRKILKDFSE